MFNKPCIRLTIIGPISGKQFTYFTRPRTGESLIRPEGGITALFPEATVLFQPSLDNTHAILWLTIPWRPCRDGRKNYYLLHSDISMLRTKLTASFGFEVTIDWEYCCEEPPDHQQLLTKERVAILTEHVHALFGKKAQVAYHWTGLAEEDILPQISVGSLQPDLKLQFA
jgi:hypothetical protein